MPVLRYDVTTGDWIALASARAARPDRTNVRRRSEPAPPVSHDPLCAFCIGNEALTPPTLDHEPDPADPSRWSTRVFENKYPALRGDAHTERRLLGPLFREMDGHGRHEVLVESPDHGRSLADQPGEQVVRVLELLHRRSVTLARDPRLEVVQIFKNSGASAGSSMPHPHFQLIATPVVPRQIRIKFATAADHYQVTGSSVYVELCRAELEAQIRIVASNEAYVAFTPFASRTPYETWILPRQPAPAFDLADRASFPALAGLLLDVLQRLRAVVDDPPFNLVINSAPRRHADEPDFVWHIELLPRLTQTAGFELATGMAINPVEPELAAERLRAAAGHE